MRATAAAAGVAACVLLGAIPSAAGIVSAPQPIAEFVAAADVVVVATLEPRSPETGVTRLRFTVERTLKGPPAVSLDASANDRLYAAHGVPLHGIWFLKSEGTSHLVLARRRPSLKMSDVAILLPREGRPPAHREEGPLERVVVEVLAALRSGADVDSLDPAFEAAFDLVFAHEMGREGAAGGAHVDEAPSLGALGRTFDRAVVTRVEAELAAGRGRHVPMNVLQGLCRVADPAVGPAVVRIVRAAGVPGPDPLRVLRRCAVDALGNIHSEEMLPVLAELLDDGDLGMKYQAVMAFSAFADGLPPDRGFSRRRGSRGPHTTAATRAHAPSYGLFLANAQKYVDFWKRWYACPSCRLEGAAR